MQATRSKIFTTGIVAVLAMVALAVSLFAAQPAHAQDLAAGKALTTQSQTPSIVVKDTAKVTVGKSITIKAENRTAGQTGSWYWEVTSGSKLVKLSNVSSASVKVAGVKGGQATLKVTYITSSGVRSHKVVKVNVYGIKDKATVNGIVYKRTGVNTVKVYSTQKNKDIGKKSIAIKEAIKLGDDSKYKVKYKITAISPYALNSQKKATKSITVGNNVTKIGSHAFANNTKQTKLTLGTGVTNLGEKIVTGVNKKLKVITIKSTKLTKASVKKCFAGNKVIKTVKVPKSKVAAYKKIFTKKNCGAKVKVVAL